MFPREDRSFGPFLNLWRFFLRAPWGPERPSGGQAKGNACGSSHESSNLTCSPLKLWLKSGGLINLIPGGGVGNKGGPNCCGGPNLIMLLFGLRETRKGYNRD